MLGQRVSRLSGTAGHGSGGQGSLQALDRDTGEHIYVEIEAREWPLSPRELGPQDTDPGGRKEQWCPCHLHWNLLTGL